MKSGEFAIVFALTFAASLLSPNGAIPQRERMITRRRHDDLCYKYFHPIWFLDLESNCMGVAKLVRFSVNESRTTQFVKDVDLALSGKLEQRMIKDIALTSVALPVVSAVEYIVEGAYNIHEGMTNIIKHPEDFVEEMEYMTKHPKEVMQSIMALPFFEIGRQLLVTIIPSVITFVGVEEGYRQVGWYDDVHKFTSLLTYLGEGGKQIGDAIWYHVRPIIKHFNVDSDQIFGKKLSDALDHWGKTHLDNLDGTYRKAVDRFWKGNRRSLAIKARESAIFFSNFLTSYFDIKTYCKKHNLVNVCDKFKKVIDQLEKFLEKEFRKFGAIEDSVLKWIEQHLFPDDEPESEVLLKRNDVKSKSSFEKTFEFEHSNNGSYCEGSKLVDKKFCYKTADTIRNAIDVPRTVRVISEVQIIEKILPILLSDEKVLEILNGTTFIVFSQTFTRIKWLQDYVQSRSLEQALSKRLSQIEKFTKNPPSFHDILEHVKYLIVYVPVNAIQAFKQALSMTRWTKGLLAHLEQIHRIIVHFLEPAIKVVEEKWRTLQCTMLFPKDVCVATAKWKGAVLRDYHEIIDSFWKKWRPMIHAYYPKVVKMLVNVFETAIFPDYCKKHLPAPLCTKFDDVMHEIKTYADKEFGKGKSIYKEVSHWITENFFPDVPK